MISNIALAPSLPVTLEPKNWQESFLYEAIVPTYSRCTQVIHLIALTILGVLFSIVTLGIGALLFPRFIETYDNYQKRVNECITTFENGLDAWVSAATPWENRVKAKEEILSCFLNQSRYLDLSSLMLNDLPPQIGQLTHLKVLTLTKNRLIALPAEIGRLVNLESLWVEENGLRSLPSEIGNLVYLENLYLDSNQLSTLPPQIGNLVNLKSLPVRKNQLNSLPEEIGNLMNLGSLSVENNQLSSLPAGIGKLVNLESLHLENNQLSSLPDEIGKLVNLQWLYLESNQLSALPTAIGKLANLRSLDVKRNRLSSLPNEIGNLVNLKTLVIELNQLRSLPEEIGQLVNLMFLEAANNQLRSLAAAIGDLVNLRTLNLQSNQMNSLPREIGGLTSLLFLYLSNNQLSSIPIEIGNLVNLTRIGIRHNQLNSLPSEMANLVKLDDLDITFNLLTTLPQSLLNLTSNTRIQVEYNRFSAAYVASLNLYRREHPNSPRIECSIYEPQIPSSNSLRTQTLPGAIKRWQDFLPKQEWPDFKVLEGHMYTGQLIKFLDRIVETKDYKDASELGRKHYAERTMSLLCLMVENKEFREIAFCDIDGGVNTCGDAVNLILNDLEALSYVYAGNKDKTMLDLAVIAIGLMRLGKIKTFALKYPAVDLVEVELLLQVRLREKLKLPIKTQSMLYPNVSGIPMTETDAFAAKVKEETSSKESIIIALLLQKFWKRRLWEENEAYNAISIEMGKRTDLDQDGIRGVTNEKLEALYLADTEAWYVKNEKALHQALRQV